MASGGLSELFAVADRIASSTNTDVILINSPFEANTDEVVLRRVEGRKHRRENVLVLIVTSGGSADAAFKVARCLQRNYKSYTAFISGYCKSAGTLCVVGAHTVVMSGSAELGPLDVQIAKRDELAVRNSGLVAGEALASLKDQAFAMYEEFFLQILRRSSGNVSFRTASDIAGQITVGLFQPVYAQINPVEVAEMARSMRIANDYGRRLDAVAGNLKDDALELLCETYPSHSFVIDALEAQSLFKRLREPTPDEAALIVLLEDVARYPVGEESAVIRYLNPAPKEPDHDTTATEAGDAAGSEPSSAEDRGESTGVDPQASPSAAAAEPTDRDGDGQGTGPSSSPEQG